MNCWILLHLLHIYCFIQGCGCDRPTHHEKREVISSQAAPNLQAMFLLQLQDKLSNLQHQYQVSDSDLRREITSASAELRQEFKSDIAQVQKQLGDIRVQIGTQRLEVDTELAEINSTVIEYHMKNTGDIIAQLQLKWLYLILFLYLYCGGLVTGSGAVCGLVDGNDMAKWSIYSTDQSFYTMVQGGLTPKPALTVRRKHKIALRICQGYTRDHFIFHELPWSCLLAHFTFSERGQLAKKEDNSVQCFVLICTQNPAIFFSHSYSL